MEFFDAAKISQFQYFYLILTGNFASEINPN
jgi:hypothetical protein